MVFSDGAAATRAQVANLAMDRNIPLVVLHDTEKVWHYKWDRLNIGSPYKRFDFRSCEKEQKATTILTNSKSELVDEWIIEGHDRIIQAYSSPTQPIVQIVYPGDSKALKSKSAAAQK